MTPRRVVGRPAARSMAAAVYIAPAGTMAPDTAQAGSRAPPATTTRSGGRPDSTQLLQPRQRDRPLAPVVALGPSFSRRRSSGWDGSVQKRSVTSHPPGPGSISSQDGGDRDPIPPSPRAPLVDPVRRRDLVDHRLHPHAPARRPGSGPPRRPPRTRAAGADSRCTKWSVKAGLLARSQRSSKTRSRGASIGVLTEIGPNARGDSMPAIRDGNPSKLRTFRHLHFRRSEVPPLPWASVSIIYRIPGTGIRYEVLGLACRRRNRRPRDR